MTNPLEGRPSLRTESGSTNALAKALGKLAREHGLRGCVLVSFIGDRVCINSSGSPDLFGRAMEQLADQILAAIDDGQFDPTVDLQ